jgi:hypothetical protein
MARTPDEGLDRVVEAAEECPGEYIFIEIDWDCVLSGYRFMEPRRDPDAGQSPDWGDSLDDLIALAARRKRVAYFCECWAAPTNSVSTSRRYW